MNLPTIPFNEIGESKHLPNPRSIVQIAVSDYRNSNLSDKELTEHICNSLALLMKDYNLKIKRYEENCTLMFVPNDE